MQINCKETSSGSLPKAVRDLQNIAFKERERELGLCRLAMRTLRTNLKKKAYNYQNGSYRSYGVKFFSRAPDGAPRAPATNCGLGGSSWTFGETSSLKSEQVAPRGCGIYHIDVFKI